MRRPAVDVLLLSTARSPRALIRAQLIDEGFDVVAVDTWADADLSFGTGTRPRLVLVDLASLPDPEGVLNALQPRMDKDRVFVIGGSGTLAPDVIARYGFHLLTRPVGVAAIVAAVSRALA